MFNFSGWFYSSNPNCQVVSYNTSLDDITGAPATVSGSSLLSTELKVYLNTWFTDNSILENDLVEFYLTASVPLQHKSIKMTFRKEYVECWSDFVDSVKLSFDSYPLTYNNDTQLKTFQFFDWFESSNLNCEI